MSISRCKHCSHKFKWKDVISSNMSGRRSVQCENCKTNNYIKVITRAIFFILEFVPLFFLNVFFDKNSVVLIIIFYFLWTAILVLISPLFTVYYEKN